MSDTPSIQYAPAPLRRRKALEASWKPILLNLLVPGWGYWILGQRGRAKILFFVTLAFLGLAWAQLTFGAVGSIRGGVYVPQLRPLEWMPTLGALATMGVGPIYTLFAWLFGMPHQDILIEPVRNLTQEYGATYLMAAGLLNWLCCFDIFDRATGRWVFRLPADEREDNPMSGGEGPGTDPQA